MIRSSYSVFVTIFSVLFLKRKVKWFHIVGLVSIVIGIALVGLSRLIGGSTSSNKPIGIVLVLLSSIAYAGVFVVEEKLLSKYYIVPLLAVGLEGLMGTAIMICIIIPIFSNVKCPISMGSSCPFKYFESPRIALASIFSSGTLLASVILFMLSLALYSYTGISITKNSSAMARGTIDSIRNLSVWIFSMIIFRESFYWL